jgi:hypothetical protein
MSNHPNPQQLYISALQERGIPYKRENIEVALDHASENGRTNAQWVTGHIGSDTLLSKEEAAL